MEEAKVEMIENGWVGRDSHNQAYIVGWNKLG